VFKSAEVINEHADEAQDVLIPAALQSCPDVARVLHQHNDALIRRTC
jgi:hypothetical protein